MSAQPMTSEEVAAWRVREDQCATWTTTRLAHDTLCLMPTPCWRHSQNRSVRPDRANPEETR